MCITMLKLRSYFEVYVFLSNIPKIINTSYQKLPFGSGDYPDKLLFHHTSYIPKSLLYEYCCVVLLLAYFVVGVFRSRL